MKCDGCLCKNCENHNNWCCDCDICENEDMTVFACNHYKETKEVKKIIVTNIEWDTDGEIIPELPTEVTLDRWTDDEDEILDCIADMLSDLYSFCVFSFEIH